MANRYVDGFLLVVPKKNLRAYAALAKQAGKVWIEHGALDYHECVGEDLAPHAGVGIGFAARVQARKNEAVVFSWITYKSRAHRDRVNAKVMKDPRLAKMMAKGCPFDVKRMSHGGFDVVVDL
jgi:uncharacterized protein YbaA (DUF1428 family)